ncbi:OsmC family protein [Limibacillus sp. MBR-115]|jgi:uncharacterized OsmC-like protein|uniref:OsmC family protein n=1 Tax=Limibacillus sp. MBR-115 TaxID=3156465 RepID=UPI00339B5AEC
MNAEELRNLQAPIKQRYKDDPSSAMVTMRVEGDLVQPKLACNVQTFAGLAEAGLHPAAGGDATQACSGDMLLEALAACAGVTLNAVATAMGIAIKGGKVLVEGDMDFRGTLGTSKETPVGFQDIRMTFAIDSDSPADKIENLVRLTERYCVVYQTLTNPPRITQELKHL